MSKHPQRLPADHDHGACISDALAEAERTCAARGLNLTSNRRRVLELIWSRHAPVGAYEVLEGLAAEGARPAPQTVYRALDFLLSAGLIHRLETRNAFIGCPDPGETHASQFLLCRKCGHTTEIHDPKITAHLQRQAKGHGFVVENQTVELIGLCPDCIAT